MAVDEGKAQLEEINSLAEGVASTSASALQEIKRVMEGSFSPVVDSLKKVRKSLVLKAQEKMNAEEEEAFVALATEILKLAVSIAAETRKGN
jgi:hypothetical protein